MTDVIWEALRRMRRDDIWGKAIWVVGGTVRDWALGRPCKDVDLAVQGDIDRVGYALAEATGGHFFVMHPASHTARVVLPGGAWVDLVPLPHGLETDLRRRDFTINAMAAPLDAFIAAPPCENAPPPWLMDPTGGWEDLRAGVLRMASPQAFAEDPLRPLRGLRLSITLPPSPGTGVPFAPEPETASAIRAGVPLLARVSPERVRDEWMLLLDSPRAVDGITRAADLGFLDILLPEWRAMEGVTQNPYHHLDVWEHTLDVFRQFDVMLLPCESSDALPEGLCVPDDLRGSILEYLAECMTLPHTRRALLHQAILLHDTGKPLTRTEDEDGRIRFFGHERTSEEIARAWAVAWKLSGKERDFVLATVGLHMRPGSLVGADVTLRAVHRFFRDAGSAAPALLLLNAADRLAARGPWTTDDEVLSQVDGSWRLLRLWFEMKKTVALPLPVSGRDVMAAFGLEPGPQVGRLIQALRDIHAETPFHDRAAALQAASAFVEDSSTD